MKCQSVFAAVLIGLLALSAPVEAKKEFKSPAGTKVATGKFFEIYVEKKE